MIKVSVIVPIYNSEKYLEKCLNTLLHQSLKDIEIILINDGSTDNSEKIIKSFSDKRIKYFYQENHGIGYTRNFGIRNSIGKYITFVDSDDYVSTRFCEKLYKCAEKDKSEIVICNFFKDYGYLENVNFENFEPASLKENPNILNKINLGPCNKIYKKSLLIDNDIFFEENLKYEDAPFVVKALVNANKISKIDDYLTYYVIHSNSETTIRDKKIFDIIKECKIITDYLSDYKYLNNQKEELIIMILSDYIIQTRYINDKNIRKSFTKEAFKFLDNMNIYWRNNKYLNNFTFLERTIKKSRFLTNIYCSFYNKRNK